MLAIYGTSGLIYRGAIEDLRRVLPTLRGARTRALAVQVDRPDFADSGWHPDRADRHAGGGPTLPRPAAVAVQAYGEVQHPAPTRHPLERVSDVMTPAVVSVGQDEPLQQAWQTLEARGLGQAPVVAAGGALVGLLTRAELLRADRLPRPDEHPLAWRAFLAQPVAAVMVSPVPAVAPEMPLRRLALLLLETGLPGVPVVRPDGVLGGFVSRTDVLKALVHDPPLDLWAG